MGIVKNIMGQVTKRSKLAMLILNGWILFDILHVNNVIF